MGSMTVEMSAKMAVCGDFHLWTTASPYTKKSAERSLYEPDHQALGIKSLEEVRDGPKQA